MQVPKAVKPGITLMGTTGADEKGSSVSQRGIVGDGGASWRLKALRRAQERAAEEGRDLGDEVRTRHASVGALAGSILSSSVASGMAHLHAAKQRRDAAGGGGTRREGQPRTYLDLEPAPEMQMRRVRDSAHSIARVTRKPAHDRQAPAADRSSKELEGVCNANGDSEPGHKHSDKKDEGDNTFGGQEQLSRKNAPARNGERERAGKEGDAMRSRNGSRSHASDLHRPGKLCKADAAVLSAAHASMNRFKSDGSFMEQFTADVTAVQQPDEDDQVHAVNSTGAPEPFESEAGVPEQVRDEPLQRDERVEVRTGNFGAAAALRARLTGKSAPSSTGDSRPVHVLPAVDAQVRPCPVKYVHIHRLQCFLFSRMIG